MKKLDGISTNHSIAFPLDNAAQVHIELILKCTGRPNGFDENGNPTKGESEMVRILVTRGGLAEMIGILSKEFSNTDVLDKIADGYNKKIKKCPPK